MNLWSVFLAFLLAVPADVESPDATGRTVAALSARATWHTFPGFVADIQLDWNGKLGHGRVIVDRDGLLSVEHLPAAHREGAILHLRKVVHQQLPPANLAGASWLFLPLGHERSSIGRAVCRADNPFGSRIWIHADTLRATEGTLSGQKYRMTTLKSERNPEDKHLPTVVVAHRWDAWTGELQATETTLLSWRRVGGVDLPARIEVLSAGSSGPPMKLASVRIVLSRHQLLRSDNYAGR